MPARDNWIPLAELMQGSKKRKKSAREALDELKKAKKRA